MLCVAVTQFNTCYPRACVCDVITAQSPVKVMYLLFCSSSSVPVPRGVYPGGRGEQVPKME